MIAKTEWRYFEEQLPDAIDTMTRALRAGHPFPAALKMIGDEFDDPVAAEFDLTFGDINYGNDVRRAMLGLLSRIPTVTVMALVTAVLVQKESGGNLAEILERISAVIRGRFKLYRKIKTLSAEGRMSAWVLAMVPSGFVRRSDGNDTGLPASARRMMSEESENDFRKHRSQLRLEFTGYEVF